MPQLTADVYADAVHRHGPQAHGRLHLKGFSMVDILHQWLEAQLLYLYTPGSIS